MSNKHAYIRHGFGTVRPYVYGNPDLIDFVMRVFDAEELERAQTGQGGLHIEVKVGDSVIALETGEHFKNATHGSIYVYVEDVDATYQRALQVGATSLSEPEDKPYHERGAGIKDTFGNTWWLSTYK